MSKKVGLTGREFEVFELYRKGSARREIAAVLGISVSTVGKHLTSIVSRTRCGSVANIAMMKADRVTLK